MSISIPNGERGLRSSQSWLLEENKGLREELAKERYKSFQQTKKIRDLTNKLHAQERAS